MYPNEQPDKIEIDDIDDLSDPRFVETMDYIVTHGAVYRVAVNDYAGEQYLERVDEIPDEYWERYDQEVNG